MIKTICDYYARSDNQVKTAFKWVIIISPLVICLFIFPGDSILLRLIVGLILAYRMRRAVQSFSRSREISDEKYRKRIQNQQEDWSEST